LFRTIVFQEDVDSNQQLGHEKLNETTPNSSAKEDQLPLSNPIIKLWEEITNNKHIIGIKYENEVTFPIPDYIKTIQYKKSSMNKWVRTHGNILLG
jgi:hypothetical protein